jgi:hypothetical protein
LQAQEDCHKPVLGLADNMICTLGYIEDVEQFARLVQLKKAIEEVQPLMEDTANFILMYTSRSGAGKYAFCWNDSCISRRLFRIQDSFGMIETRSMTCRKNWNASSSNSTEVSSSSPVLRYQNQAQR